MLSVLLGVLGGFQSSEFAMGKTLSLTEVQRTQIVTLRGEDYTEMDTAPWLRCTMLLSKSMVVHGRLYTGNTAQWADGNVFIKKLLQENLCYFTLKRYSNKFQHCFETSQQRILTEVLQSGMKATPDTSDEEKETGLCQTSSPLDSRWVGRKCCFLMNAPYSSLYLTTCTLSDHSVRVLTRNRL